ncbi:MAG: beta strand repeat-containing protein, partial [Burkholderiales bacterium]
TGNWLVDPVNFTVADSGGDMTGTTLQSNLGTSNVELQSAAGATNGLGDVNINTSINWSANTTLTLTASNNVNVNANMMATGSSAGLVIKPNTANTYLSVTQSASGSGVFNLLFGKYIKLTGALPSLSIAGQSYTVINSLGSATSSGDGTLQGMRGNLSGYYALGSNIDASATSGWNAGAGFTPIADGSQFTGTFNGLGNNISSLYISSPSTTASTQNTGLFYTIGTAGNVSNLGIRSGTVQSLGTPGAIGSLAGINNGTILKSYSAANVSSAATTQAVGGLVGINNGTIQYSYASGNVTGGTSTRAIGGLIGVNTATVTESFATGNVLAGANSGGVGINPRGVGGLIGYSEGTVSGAYATGSVSVSGYGEGVGGLIGFGNSLTLSKAYSTGNIEVAGSAQNVGGLIAETLNSTVTDAYATGNIQVAGAGTEVGSLVGLHRNNTISNAYSTGQITLGSGSTQGFYGSSSSGGTFSNIFWNTTSSGLSTAPGKPGITGITGAQMQTLSTFSSAGWDTTTWGQVSGQNSDFPVLGVGHSALYLRLVSSSSTYGSTPTLTYKLYNNDIAGIEVIGYRLSGTPSWKITQSGTAVAATTLAATSSAGIYSLTYASGLSLVNGNSGVFAGAANNWTINTKTLTASIATGNTVYGSPLLPGTVTLSGVVNGDSVSPASVVINTSGLLSGGGQLKVGSHLGIQSVSGVLSGAGAANYTFAGATGNYTVTPKTLTGLISASNSVYGANLVKGTVSLSGLVSGDNVIPDNTVSIALAAANKSTSGNLKAGSYTGIQTAPATLSGTLADIANYTYTGATGDYTVSKATLGG